MFAHVVVQPSSPTITPGASSFGAQVRFYDQTGLRYAPSAAGNLTVTQVVNQDGTIQAPWMQAGNLVVTYNGSNGEYDVTLSNLSGQVLGDRLWVTLQQRLENGTLVNFGFGIEVRNVPPQTVANPQFGDPDFR